jgi:hypothetical protein
MIFQAMRQRGEVRCDCGWPADAQRNGRVGADTDVHAPDCSYEDAWQDAMAQAEEGEAA